MRRTGRAAIATAATLAWIGVAAPVRAGHHQWDFTEIFSNADGSIQFIEMIGTADNEHLLNGFGITVGANTFTFVGNLPDPNTNGRWVLIATEEFEMLPGAPAADYTLAGSFFPTGGGTLVYDVNKDTWAYGTVPTDGVLSLTRDGNTPVNSPTNFAGASASVNANLQNVPSMPALAAILLVGAVLLAALRRAPRTA